MEWLLTTSTVLIRYKNPVYPVYPCLNPDPPGGKDGKVAPCHPTLTLPHPPPPQRPYQQSGYYQAH